MALARLQTGFVEQQRNGIMRASAAAPELDRGTLRHARITSPTTDSRCRGSASSAQFLIQGGVAAVTLIVQGALAIVLGRRWRSATATRR